MTEGRGQLKRIRIKSLDVKSGKIQTANSFPFDSADINAKLLTAVDPVDKKIEETAIALTNTLLEKNIMRVGIIVRSDMMEKLYLKKDFENKLIRYLSKNENIVFLNEETLRRNYTPIDMNAFVSDEGSLSLGRKTDVNVIIAMYLYRRNNLINLLFEIVDIQTSYVLKQILLEFDYNTL